MLKKCKEFICNKSRALVSNALNHLYLCTCSLTITENKKIKNLYSEPIELGQCTRIHNQSCPRQVRLPRICENNAFYIGLEVDLLTFQVLCQDISKTDARTKHGPLKAPQFWHDYKRCRQLFTCASGPDCHANSPGTDVDTYVPSRLFGSI